MQHTLLSIALALIVAIVAAIAAPLFVDWNAWRPAFEQRASALVGARVSITGPIEATILPVPAFTLRDVVIGDAERGTGLKGSQIRGILSLGALLRGSIEAEEIILSKPAMRLTLNEQGHILLDSEPGKEMGSFSISRITIDSGSLVVDRASAGQVQFENISANGELQSRSGPLKLDASLTRDGRQWNLRATTGQFGADSSGKLRLTLSRPDDNTLLEADGSLAVTDAFPRFEGKLNISGRKQSELPWKLSANAKTSVQLVAFEMLEISLGNEMPIELSGKANFEPRKGGRFEAELSANRIDLDRVDENQKAPSDVIAAFPTIREALQLASRLPFSGKARLSIGQIVAGGGTIRELRSELSLREGFLAPERLDARLPGRGAISINGTVKDASFSGALKLSAEDSIALSRWLGLEAAGIAIDRDGPIALEGRVLASTKQIAMEPLNLTLSGMKVGGAAAYLFSEGDRRMRVAAKLTADALDLALFASAWHKFLAGPPVADVMGALNVTAPRAFGQTARRFDIAFSRNADEIFIERLMLEDLSGLTMHASGRVASYPERSSGQIEFEGVATRPEGLNALVESVTTGDGGAFLRRIAAAAMPLRIAGTIKGDGSGPDIAIQTAVNANEAIATFTGQVDARSMTVLDARVIADARDASKLVALLGLPSPEPQAGQGRFEARIGERKDGAMPLNASLVFPGIRLAGDGDLRVGAGGRIEPRINLRLEATDLRALSIAAARVSNSVVAASGTARLVRSGNGIAFEDFALNLGDIRTRGRVALSGVEQPALSGELSFNRTDLSAILALALGQAGDGIPWPDQALGPKPFENASGTLEIESAALRLTGPLVATGSRLKLLFDKNQIKIDDFSGDLAGGKLSGRAKIVQGDTLSLDAGISLVSADVARLIAPGTWRSIASGKTTFGIEIAGQGTTPSQLAGNLAGKGVLVFDSIEIDKLDPDSVSKVVAVTAGKQTPDAASVTAAFNKALAQGPLRIAKVEMPVFVATGVARTGNVKAAVGSIQVSSETTLDLAKLNFDAAIEFEGVPPQGMNARPGATVRWSGPLSQPERTLDISSLETVLALRSMDSEMRKLDGRDRPPVSASALAQPPITESSLIPAQIPATSIPLPRRRPVDLEPIVVPQAPAPVDINPPPGAPRPIRMN